MVCDFLVSDFLGADAFGDSALDDSGWATDFLAAGLIAVGLLEIGFWAVGVTTAALLGVNFVPAAFLTTDGLVAGFLGVGLPSANFLARGFSIDAEVLADLACFVLTTVLGLAPFTFAAGGLIAEALIAGALPAATLLMEAWTFPGTFARPAGGTVDFVFFGAAALVEDAGVTTFV